ncbi:MAG: flagellin [Acidobacteriota bacterium]
MGFSAINNISALTAKRSLGMTQNMMDRTLGRLATGLRINRASDDAAGLAISSGLRGDIRAMQQGIRNAHDGISYVQVTEGALEEINTILTRMKELAEQGASDTTGVDDASEKEALQAEVGELLEEIDRINAATNFNGRSVLQDESIDVQIGITNGTESQINIDTGGATGLDVTTANLSIDTLDVSNKSGALSALDAVDTAIDTIASLRGDLGATQSRLESGARNQANVLENVIAAESRIRDADIASEVVNLTKSQILSQSGMSALAQANGQAQSVLSLLG